MNMNIFKKTNLLMVSALLTASLFSCGDDENGLDPNASNVTEDDYKYVGQAIGNFKAEEWYPGGELGTTENTTASCYEDETEAINNADLLNAFKRGEMLFEHDFTQTSTASFGGLGPAYVRSSCIHCHPGYGHGKRVNSYQADQRGNGYLSTATTDPISLRSPECHRQRLCRHSCPPSTRAAFIYHGSPSRKWRADCPCSSQTASATSLSTPSSPST